MAGGSYEVKQKMGDDKNGDSEHWAEGAHHLVAMIGISRRRQVPMTIDMQVP
jgi:hypothetical protein